MIHSIAVTTDFSAASLHSLHAAVEIAGRFKARLQLVHVATDDAVAELQALGEAVVAVPTPREDVLRSLERRVAGFAQKAQMHSKVAIEPRVLFESSPGTLRRFQESEGIDLILAASHGHTGVKQFLLGSFATRILHEASCPMLVLRVPEWKNSHMEAQFHPHRILVPHDFSLTSAASLEIARSWARAFDASVRILYVVTRPPECEAGSATIAEDLSTRLESAESAARTRLLEIVQRDWEGIAVEPVTCVAVPTEGPAGTIVREAADLHADLIIMASHGEGARDSRPLGTVAERTIHAAQCPLLVVKRKATDWTRLEV